MHIQTLDGCIAHKNPQELDIDVDTMSTLPPLSISDGSDSDCPVGPRWADMDFEEEDEKDSSACSVLSSDESPPSLNAYPSAQCSTTWETAPQNRAVQMQAWQWVPVTMMPVATQAASVAASLPHHHFAQKDASMFDFKQALEARKAAMGHMVNELAAASKKAEHEGAVGERSTKMLSPQNSGLHGRGGGRERTTIMIRSIPSGCTRAMIQATLDWEGFAGQYDFLYLPCSFDDWSALGHAFVNFPAHRNAERATAKLSGRVLWPEVDSKPCEVCWSKALQGLAACVGRFRNSPVMDPCMSDAYKPILLKKGVRSAFPEPTKQIQPVRGKNDGN